MKKVEEATAILSALGLPEAQRNERSALTLLALGDIRPKTPWMKATQVPLRILDMMEFMREHYKKDYAPNSRETIRRQTIHQFEQAGLVNRNLDDPSRPTNSGKTVYTLSDAARRVLQTYGTSVFNDVVAEFIEAFGSLQAAYRKERATSQVPLRLKDGGTVLLSPGEHNVLQVSIVEEFGPRFAPGAAVLYLGDTAKKHVVYEKEELAQLNFPITEHDKLPDVVVYVAEKNWLFLIEAVTSHGPVSPKRHREMEKLLKDCTAGRVYVSAFPSKADFRRFSSDIAWETEVWIADHPDHLIHFNGPRFLGPYCATPVPPR